MPVNRSKIHFDHIFKNAPLQCGAYTLYQVGDLCCEPGYQTKAHRQVVYEITYVVSGTGTFQANNQEYPMRKGQLLLIRKGEMHNIISSCSDPLRYFYLGFDFLQPVTDRQKSLWDFYQKNAACAVNCESDIPNVFMKLFSEFIANDAVTPLLIETYMQEILSLTQRFFENQRHPSYRFTGNEDPDRKLVYDMMHYIDTHLETLDNLNQLSMEFGYSYTHLAQKFSALTGQTLKSYHTMRRFERANDYLRQGYSITDTAEKMGFQSIHAFSRAYKSYFHITPGAYMKKEKEKKQ